MLETERRNTRSHYIENSLWKKLWTCRKTDYVVVVVVMMMIMMIIMNTEPIVCQLHAIHNLTHKDHFSSIRTSSTFPRAVQFRGSTSNF